MASTDSDSNGTRSTQFRAAVSGPGKLWVVGVLLPWLGVAALLYVVYRVVRTARQRRTPEPETTPPAPEREPARVP